MQKSTQSRVENFSQAHATIHYSNLLLYTTVNILSDYFYQVYVGLAPPDRPTSDACFARAALVLFPSSEHVRRLARKFAPPASQGGANPALSRAVTLAIGHPLARRVRSLHERHPLVRHMAKLFGVDEHMPRAMLVLWAMTAEWLADIGVIGDTWLQAYDVLRAALATPALPLGVMGVLHSADAGPLAALGERWLRHGLRAACVPHAEPAEPAEPVVPAPTSPFEVARALRVEGMDNSRLLPDWAQSLWAARLGELERALLQLPARRRRCGWPDVVRRVLLADIDVSPALSGRAEPDASVNTTPDASVNQSRPPDIDVSPALSGRAAAPPATQPERAGPVPPSDIDVSPPFDLHALPDPDRTTPWFDPVADRLAWLHLPLWVDPETFHAPVSPPG